MKRVSRIEDGSARDRHRFDAQAYRRGRSGLPALTLRGAESPLNPPRRKAVIAGASGCQSPKNSGLARLSTGAHSWVTVRESQSDGLSGLFIVAIIFLSARAA